MKRHHADQQRIAFIIATLGHGRGGHFWSLKTTAEALSHEVDCFIIDVGVSPSPVIQSASVRSYHVPFSGLDIRPALRTISRILTNEHPDVINLFDGRIDLLARLAGMRLGIPLVRTKCGGPPPKRFFPYFDTLIVYSVEDLDWFSHSRKFSRSNIALIPNRTMPFACDPDRIADLRSRIAVDRPVFLRIARFTKYYETSMLQAINLVKRLNCENVPCQLVLVGFPEDREVYGRIAAASQGYVHIFTEDRFTLNAKALIDVADYVIGTGRGFMEAASRGKVLLSPLAQASLPVLVTQRNFAQIFASNLSPRNQVDGCDEEANYREIRRALLDVDCKRDLEDLACRLNAEFFDIHSALGKHKAVYSSVRGRTRPRLSDLVYGFYYLAQCFRSCH